MMSILRQELDSLIRVLYLLSITDIDERERLMSCTLSGERWKITTNNGKKAIVTDAVMVEASQNFEGWAKSVYKFGCAFIHLSNFHGYLSSNPLDAISNMEKADILEHMRCYHHGPTSDNPTFNEFSEYFNRVNQAGHIENTYVFKIRNKSNQSKHYKIAVEGLDNANIIGQEYVEVMPLELKTFSLAVEVNQLLPETHNDIGFKIISEDDKSSLLKNTSFYSGKDGW